jgi:hypothetical protein
MMAERPGNAERWAALRARRRQEQIDKSIDAICAAFASQIEASDPIERFAVAASGAVGRKRPGTASVLPELAAGLDRLTARQQATMNRNAGRKAAAWRRYQEARERFSAEYHTEEPAPGPSPIVAALYGFGSGPGKPVIF